MEHKRDADAAGLSWPRSNTRTSQSTSSPSDASSSAVPLNPPPQGNPMAPTTLGSSSAGDNSLTTSGMYPTGTQPRLRSQLLNIVIPLFLIKVDLANDWSTRFTLRSLPTPTAHKNYSSWRYRQQEFQEPEIPNISSMPCRDNGSGPSIQPTTGVTTLVCPCAMEPFHSRTISHRTWNLPSPRHRGQPLLSLLQSCKSVCPHLWHLANFRSNGSWCSE